MMGRSHIFYKLGDEISESTVNAMNLLTLYLDLHDMVMYGQVFIITFVTCIVLYASNI